MDLDTYISKRNFVTYSNEWVVLILDKQEYRELKWLFYLIRKHDEANMHMVIEWRDKKSLTTAKVMDPIY